MPALEASRACGLLLALLKIRAHSCHSLPSPAWLISHSSLSRRLHTSCQGYILARPTGTGGYLGSLPWFKGKLLVKQSTSTWFCSSEHLNNQLGLGQGTWRAVLPACAPVEQSVPLSIPCGYPKSFVRYSCYSILPFTSIE